MSNVDIHCDLISKYENTIGDLESKPHYESLLATSIASEVVNDIIDAALDIAICKSVNDGRMFLDIDWEKSCEVNFKGKLAMEAFDLNTSAEVITPNIKQLIEGLNSISVNNNINTPTKPEEPVRLDIEMKRLLTDMMSPPYPVVNYEPIKRKDGVGDQSPQHTMQDEIQYLENKSEDILVDPEQTRIVEKKSRVTDLVMNSKQVLSELLMDENKRKSMEEWEEANEQVLKVINLECVEPSAELTKEISFEKKPVCKIPENTNILAQKSNLQPCDDIIPCEGEIQNEEEEEQILPIPNEKVMDIVDLSKDCFQEEERLLCCGMDCGNYGGKGDEYTMVGVQPNVNKSTSKRSQDVATCEEQVEKKDTKKKKWNFGSRLWGFIKKRPQKNKDSASTESFAAQQ